VAKKKMGCANNTKELPVIEEERFDLNTSPAIFCHQQMTKEYCFFFTSFKAYRE